MESMIFDAGPDEETPEDEFSEDEDEEKEFMRGYAEEDEVVTCEECGVAIRGKPLVKTIDGEKYMFCSQECAQEFEESLG